MTNRPPAASRRQNSSSHQSIELVAPPISSTAGSRGSPNVSTHNSMPLTGIIVSLVTTVSLSLTSLHGQVKTRSTFVGRSRLQPVAEPPSEEVEGGRDAAR